MEARLPFVMPCALTRETQAAAGASSSSRFLKVAAQVGAGCPSFGGQRTASSARTEEDSQRLSKHVSLSIEAQSFESASLHQSLGSGAFFQNGSVLAPFVQLAHPALVCFAVQIQGEAAAPRAWPNSSFKRTRLRRSAYVKR